MNDQSSNQHTSTADSDDDNNMILLDTVPEESRTMTWLAAAGFSFTLQILGRWYPCGWIGEQSRLKQQPLIDLSFYRGEGEVWRHLFDIPVVSLVALLSGEREDSVFLLYGPPRCGTTLFARPKMKFSKGRCIPSRSDRLVRHLWTPNQSWRYSRPLWQMVCWETEQQ